MHHTAHCCLILTDPGMLTTAGCHLTVMTKGCRTQLLWPTYRCHGHISLCRSLHCDRDTQSQAVVSCHCDWPWGTLSLAATAHVISTTMRVCLSYRPAVLHPTTIFNKNKGEFVEDHHLTYLSILLGRKRNQGGRQKSGIREEWRHG